jgi:protein ImuB
MAVRWLALHFPALSLDLLESGGDLPLAIVEPRNGRSVVCLANPAAGRCGVQPGLGAGGARALCTGLRLRERDPAREAEALQRLAAWACQFTSQLCVEPDALLLEIGRSARLFGGLHHLTGQVAAGLAGLGFTAVPFLAPTPEGALRLARRGEAGEAADLAELERRLGTLPLAALPLDERARRGLHDAGLRRLGELLALPRPGLARRVGPDFLDWLDRLLGVAPDPRPPFTPPATYQGRLELPAEIVAVEGLIFPARRLVGELAGFLLGRQLGAQRLDWRLDHAAVPPSRFALGLARPEREAERLLGLLRERLQRLDLPAPVRALGLSVDDLVPLPGRPLDLLDGRAAEQGLQLLERLRARFGPDAVTGLEVRPDHRPERACAPCAPGRRGIGCRFPLRPLWLLPRPEPLAVREGLPRWRGGLSLEAGRERIESAWWTGAGAARDYFVARTDTGERLWVYRDLSSNRWFLQGVFE